VPSGSRAWRRAPRRTAPARRCRTRCRSEWPPGEVVLVVVDHRDRAEVAWQVEIGRPVDGGTFTPKAVANWTAQMPTDPPPPLARHRWAAAMRATGRSPTRTWPVDKPQAIPAGLTPFAPDPRMAVLRICRYRLLQRVGRDKGHRTGLVGAAFMIVGARPSLRGWRRTS
jgi:hypothetical protein